MTVGRSTFLMCLLLVLAAACGIRSARIPRGGPGATSAALGQIERRSYTNSAGTRSYALYQPSSGSAGKPLMIWLHGCALPSQMKAGHALSRVAEEKGFAIAFPLQAFAHHPGLCWNWFNPAHNHRGVGEASIIAGITTSLRSELGSDPSRIYVGGYSAGGAMSTVMGAAYPDLYAAIAPSAGAPYSIIDATGALTYAEMGPRARPVPAFILRGATDEISVHLIGRANILSWLGADDYADDGSLNFSVSRTPSSVELRVVKTDIPLPLTIEHYVSGGCEVAQLLTSPYEHLLNGALFYFDPGIELQRLMMDFLLSKRLGGPRVGCG